MSQALVDDDLWKRLEPLLPKRRPRSRQYAGRKQIPDRAVLTGILFVLRSGIPWNMLPPQMGCGSGSTCWRRLVRWQRAGVWKRLHRVLLTELRRRGQLDLARAVVDGVHGIDVIDGNDVRMIQRRGCARLLPETTFPVDSIMVFAKDLDGDFAIQSQVVGFVDYTQAAAPNLATYLVTGE